jgi:preprotein translocase subunit SecG
MIIGISIVHIIAAIALVMIVLLQTGRGSEIGAAFGSGASQTIFGSSGSSGFMTRITTIVVIVFMVTSLVLAIMYSRGRSIPMVRPRAPVQQPVKQQQLPQLPMQQNAPAKAPAVPAVPGK